MKVWGVVAPDRIRELVRVGALVKGKVMAVDGNRILLDFGDFVGEGEWEATQPLPNEGDVILVRIEGEGFPIPLKFVKRLKVASKEVVARRLPEIVLTGADFDERSVKEFAAVLKIATAIAQTARGDHGHGEKVQNQQPLPLFIALPLVMEERNFTLYMLVDEDRRARSGPLYTVRLFLEDTPWGPLRVDLGYLEGLKRITVSLILKDPNKVGILQDKVEELKRRLSAHGMYPSVFVFSKPELVGKIPLVSARGIVERRA